VPGLIHPYNSEAYARAFDGLAHPITLTRVGTSVLKRPILGTARHDVAGCYPLTVLPDLTGADADFAALRERGFVSLVLVADAFFSVPPDALRACFDLVRPFKSHFLHDYGRPFAYGRHHRYEVKRARADCEVRPTSLAQQLPQWDTLYEQLCVRHGISGLHRFSPRYFERLAALPAVHALAAWHDDELLGMHLFVEHEGVAYSHLAAFSEHGYRLRAGYALNDAAIGHFRGRRLIDFGGGAGPADNAADGLTIFKRGFANRSEVFQLCGKILDGEAYAQLAAGAPAGGYFPAYRGR
jgi:hypothetical protein